MKIAVFGSRDFPNYLVFEQLMDNIVKSNDVIVTGYDPETHSPRGVDKWAYEYASMRDIETKTYPADWSKGKGAGFARNKLIAKHGEIGVAFWDGESNGTLDTMQRMVRQKKSVSVIVIRDWLEE